MHIAGNIKKMPQIPGRGEAVMTVRNLYKSFGSHRVLVDFSLRINSGENVGVLG